MSKRVVFTIVAKNYTGLATILGNSIKEHSEDTTFVVFIADEINQDFSFPETGFIYLIAKETIAIDNSTWTEMAFKYNLTEFCTAIKPFCFTYLFDKYGAENIIYFDPDILLFSSLNPVWNVLQEKDIIITPHIVTPETIYSGVFPETNILATGIYNLGFIGIKKTPTSTAFINWWQNRLTEKCFIDKIEGLFTDQKWIDFLPALFDSSKIEISKNLGLNAAPWNFYERKFIKEDGTWYITNRITGQDKDPLIFVHFSGFNYKELNANAASNKNIFNLKVYDDIMPVLESYAAIIKQSDYAAYFNYSYTYGCFDNGQTIVHFHRRLFRRLLMDSNETGNPFLTGGKQSFYTMLAKAKLVLSSDLANVDKLNERNFDSFASKLRTLNILHRSLKKLLGARYYFLFAKLMLRYYRPENQVFLIDKKYMKVSFKNEHY